MTTEEIGEPLGRIEADGVEPTSLDVTEMRLCYTQSRCQFTLRATSQAHGLSHTVAALRNRGCAQGSELSRIQHCT
jgi:hypothetical protein